MSVMFADAGAALVSADDVTALAGTMEVGTFTLAALGLLHITLIKFVDLFAVASAIPVLNGVTHTTLEVFGVRSQLWPAAVTEEARGMLMKPVLLITAAEDTVDMTGLSAAGAVFTLIPAAVPDGVATGHVSPGLPADSVKVVMLGRTLADTTLVTSGALAGTVVHVEAFPDILDSGATC